MSFNAFLIWEARNGGSASNGGGFRNNLYQSPPSAPAVSGSASGGTIAAGTYYCVLTYSPATGGATSISGETSVTLTGATSSFTVTHPTDPGNSSTWNLYVATTSGGPYFPQGTALAIGSNRSVTSTPPTSGTQPAGTDRTLSTTPFVAIDNSTITTSITTNVITFTGYTPTGADVGNVVKMLTGTNVTVQWCEITAITSTTWTLDKNVVTSGTTTNATGNMGGALDYPGTIQAIAVGLNIIMVKYNASSYSFPSALTFSQSPLLICGYDTNRTLNNTDANRPIFQPTSNSILMFNCNLINFYNIDFVNPVPKTGISGISLGGGIAKNCRFNTYQSYAITVNGGYVIDCEFINCGSGNIAINMSGIATLERCIFKGCSSTGQGVVLISSGSNLIDCICDGHVASSAFNGAANFVRCIARGGTTSVSHGFVLSGTGNAYYESCIADSNAGWGFTATTTRYLLGTLNRCVTRANTLGAINPAAWASDQQIACLTLSSDPFNNAAAYDYSPNSVAGGGAVLRANSITSWGGGSTSYSDIGPIQHLGSSFISNSSIGSNMRGGFIN